MPQQLKVLTSSCYQPHAPFRADSAIAQGIRMWWHGGDLGYMDGINGTPGTPQFGEQSQPNSFPDGGTGATITCGAAGTGGSLPLTTPTITATGVGYGFDPTVNYDAQLSGQGLTTLANMQFTTAVSVTFTGAITAAASATLSAGLAEGSGKFWFGFSDGSRKLVTVSGTACSWTGNITATATAQYSAGGNATFTGALSGATSGTLSATMPKGDGKYLFTFSSNQYRVVTVTGTSAKWNGAVTATASFSYADGGIRTVTMAAGGLGATNVGAAPFSVVNWNGTPGFWTRRFSVLMAPQAMRDIQAARRVNGGSILFKAGPDDHERANNYAGSIGDCPWPCGGDQNPASLASDHGDVIDFWRTCNAGILAAFAQWSDFTPITNPGDLPNSLVGWTGIDRNPLTAAQVPLWYSREDWDAVGNLIGVDANAGQLTVTTITLDCVSTKSPQWQANDGSKYMIQALQEAQFKADCLDAMAKGVKAIWGLCGKDFYNGDNGDGWGAFANSAGYPTYSTARDRLLLWCQTNNVPIVWATGDRHCWHVAMTSITNGDSWDHISMCATPLGATNGTPGTATIGNTPYPQMIAQGRERDQVVHGMLTWDNANSQTIMQVIDNADDTEQWRAIVPAGARIPSKVWSFGQLRAA